MSTGVGISAPSPFGAGGMSFDELRTMCKDFLGISGTSKDSMLLGLFNFAQDEIARVHQWKCLMRVSRGRMESGNAIYPWPARIQKIFGVWGGEGSEGWPIWAMPSAEALKKYDIQGQGSGKPTRYVNLGNDLLFIPTPGSDYSYLLYFAQWPTHFTESSKLTQSSDLAHMDDLLVHWAAMLAALQMGMLDDYNVFRTAIFYEHPLGRGMYRRGLLRQAIALDESAPDQRFIKRQYDPRGEVLTGSYLANPYKGID